MTLLSAVAPVELTPFDAYLAKQTELTAVDRFSRHHANDLDHHQARYYRDLIPLAKPEPGQQYGFEVDLDTCTGCKACVAACHGLNGLDEGESWRTVTLLHSGATTATPSLYRGAEPSPRGATAHQQTVTSSCHHCVDPACLKGCPVDAYEKDPITGIVSHLDDQCIGCSYCTLACPYEVPVYNHARGIVRKCDMCKDRLAVGEAPACVQGCPNQAISIRVIDIATAREMAARPAAVVVIGAPPSAITTPTTVYRSTRENALSSERVAAEERPADPHTPLAVMLVLTQLSVGAFVIDQLLRILPGNRLAGASRTFDAVLALTAGLVAIAASVFHLGRPRYAYRAVIGLRHSWLSREVVAFGGFTALAAAYAVVAAFRWPFRGHGALAILGAGAAAFGLAGIACSVMIYATTNRASWRARRIVPRFSATAIVCGLAAVVWAAVVSSFANGSPFASSHGSQLVAMLGFGVVTLAGDIEVNLGDDPDRARVARLQSHQLRGVTTARFVTGAIGGVCLPLVLLAFGRTPAGWIQVAVATLAVGLLTAGELFERSLFFTTASRPR